MSIELLAFLAMCAGGAIAAGAMHACRARRDAYITAAWVYVAGMNTLMRLDLDHLSGDDDNHALREARNALKELVAKRPASERALFRRYNGLVGIALAFGENVHDRRGVVDSQAVANRRTHLHNALAVGDQLEAALGGIDELARCADGDRRERVRQSYQVIAVEPIPTPA